MIEDKLIELIETFKYPVMRQGSMGSDEIYPPVFFTFWCRGEDEVSAYDNQTAIVLYEFDVNVYADDPQIVYDLIRRVRVLLKQNGFIILSRAYDVASDEDTHIGRGLNVGYLNQEN